ncbi:GntR family transcriptional regulator [Mailhella sp.]|uniref:GntR family transcriptional regulator n=1 Tax=Mailhella sp. TaxID=1981029 RepID=UPI003AB597CA
MQQFSKPTYSEKVAQLIMQRIRNGRLKAGDPIGEAALAQECGISRAPVREALHHLEAEGLLMSHPKRGKCVTILTPESIRANYELSALLESEAAERAADGMSDAVLKKLASLIEKMKAAIECGGAFEEHAELGTEFHETILGMSDNPLLRSLASRFSRVISKFLLYQEWRTIYTPEELFDRHNRIYEALRSRDRERIRRAIRAHYAESAERLACFCDTANAQRGKKGSVHFPSE